MTGPRREQVARPAGVNVDHHVRLGALTEAAGAHHCLEAGGTPGRIVLTT
ncbi:MAG TPA: hypothetical protein VNO31_05510 [Umezawaea sp.]|nr:hypothetical protein [Umezawaea sp.]